MLKSIIALLAIAMTTFVANAQEITPQAEEQTETTAQITTEFTNSDIEDQLASADVALIEALHNEGFDFNQKDSNGNPPIYYLLSQNVDLEVIKKAIEYGADVNATAKNGVIPLNITTSKANELQLHIMMMKTMGLDTSNPDVQEELKKTLFHEMTKAIETAKLLVENGADVNLVSSLGTPLMNAVTNVWNLEIVKIFLDAGADVNAVDKNGKTALFYAYASSNDEVVNLLIEHGADTTITDYEGKVYSDMKKVNIAPAL